MLEFIRNFFQRLKRCILKSKTQAAHPKPSPASAAPQAPDIGPETDALTPGFQTHYGALPDGFWAKARTTTTAAAPPSRFETLKLRRGYHAI